MIDNGLKELTSALRNEVQARTEGDTPDAPRLRVAVMFAALYDNEPGEPDQAIRDLLTDIMHEAEARGVDMTDALCRAAWMHNQERQAWGRE